MVDMDSDTFDRFYALAQEHRDLIRQDIEAALVERIRVFEGIEGK